MEKTPQTRSPIGRWRTRETEPEQQMRPLRVRETLAIRRYVGVAAATMLLNACSEATQPRVPTSVQVDRTSVQLEQGESVTVTATLLDQHGSAYTTPPPGYAITWASSAPSVASVNGGVITGESPGNAVVTATAGSLAAARIEVQVIALPVAGVQLYTSTNLVRLGTPLQLTAYVFDVRGNVLTGKPVTWTSLDPELASVSETGLLTGHQPGWARIRVTSEGHSDSLGFHVRPTLCTGTPVGTIAIGETVTGALSTSDCDAPFQGPWPIGTFAAAWRLELATAATVQIELTSSQFGTVLYLSDLSLNLVAYHNDGGSSARIERSLPPGAYLIWVSSFLANQTGAYQLSVR